MNVRILVIQVVNIIRIGVIIHAWIKIFGSETFASPETCAKDDVGATTESQSVTSDPIGQCGTN